MRTSWSSSWSGPATITRVGKSTRRDRLTGRVGWNGLFAGRKQPVVVELLLDLADYRPVDAKVGVADRRRRAPRDHILVADIEAADKGGLPVNDQTFLVQPEIEERHLPRQRRVKEARYRDAVTAQPMIGGGQDESAAKPVDQDAGLDPPANGSRQSVDELHADHVGAEDVAAEPDMVFRALDRGQHLRVGLIAAIENRSHLAGRQFAAGDSADSGFQAIERFIRRFVARGRRIVASNRPLQPLRATPDPIDAESGIKDRSENRREPGKPDPADCGGNIAFGQEHVDSHGAGHQEMKDADEKRVVFERRGRREI